MKPLSETVDTSVLPRMRDEPRITPPAFSYLDAARQVMMDPDACLALRPAAQDCDKCRSACPVSAFDWTESGVLVTERCLGCGRCAAACPTGALKVRGFSIEPLAAIPAADAIGIECARVPGRFLGDAIRVPCVGGLSGDDLVTLCASAGGRPVRLIDRGWCAACPAGGAGFCAAGAVEAASAVLDALGCEQSVWPRVERMDTPLAHALDVRGGDDSELLGRRAIFGAFARRVAAAAKAEAPKRVRAGPKARHASPSVQAARRRFAHGVRRLSERATASLPAIVFPELQIDSSCDHSGLCAAVCPSGALRTYQDEDAATGLEFEAALCVACGICAERCPSRAIRVRPAGNATGELRDVPERLTRFSMRHCGRCGETFVGKGGESKCESCKTDRALFASLFPALSGVPEGTGEKVCNRINDQEYAR